MSRTMGEMYPRLLELPGYEEIAAQPFPDPAPIPGVPPTTPEDLAEAAANNSPEAPSLGAKAANLAGAVGRHVAGSVARIAEGRPLLASPETQAARKAICEACPNLVGGKCRLCGCTYMDAKRSMPAESCPDTPPRWAAEP